MKILLVEDDHFSAILLLNVMSPYGQCQMVSNGQEAVEAFQKALDDGMPFDLVITDIMMPVMDGQTALKKIREIEISKGIGGADMVKAIMLTALDDYETVMKSFKNGAADAFMSKPLDPDALKKHLDKLFPD